MVDDMLSSVLGAMQVSGTLLLRETYSSPWAIDLPDSAALASVFGLSPALHVVAFHLVERGEFEITEAGERPRTIRKGEMAISFGGVPHRMSHGTVTHAVPVAEIFASAGGASVEDLQRVKPGAPVTQLICGAFLLRNTRLNPLIAALPRMAHVSTNVDRQPAGQGWLAGLTCRAAWRRGGAGNERIRLRRRAAHRTAVRRGGEGAHCTRRHAACRVVQRTTRRGAAYGTRAHTRQPRNTLDGGIDGRLRIIVPLSLRRAVSVRARRTAHALSHQVAHEPRQPTVDERRVDECRTHSGAGGLREPCCVQSCVQAAPGCIAIGVSNHGA